MARRVWALARPYFVSSEGKMAWTLLIAIIALNLASVYMAVLFNDWNKLFYDALQDKNESVFWTQLARFCYLAVAFIVIAVYKFYLTQRLSMRWRAWMTAHYLERWLSNNAFYQIELLRFASRAGQSDSQPDNPDQRIQEDISQFCDLTISLSMGVLNSTVTLVSFVGILWGLSGGFAFTLGGEAFNIPGFMVWMALLYSVAGSVLTHYIGRPQIRLNFEQQRLEADFRHHMVRVREYSESIALDKGQPFERAQLQQRFQRVLGNLLQLIQAQKRLVWFTSFFGQAATVFPILVAAPRFFSGAIQLGDLMQISSSFGQVQSAMSWMVDNYNSLATWRATTDRLTSFEQTFQRLTPVGSQLARTDASTPTPTPTSTQAPNQAPSVSHLQINLPDGQPLIEGSSLQVNAGDHIALRGQSGCGKSSLFRVMAGIWPFATGVMQMPADCMFVPQHPYFPNGPLSEALAYPEAANIYSDQQMQDALRSAELAGLCSQLDQSNAWSQTLSGGEQQRLAIARVLLKRPRWVFADEATSALDSATALKVYQQLFAMSQDRQGAIVSIAHQPAIAELCNRCWQVSESTAKSTYRFQVEEVGAAEASR